MKKLCIAALAGVALASAARAADMPVKAPQSPAPIFNWTGFYIGGTAGYAWGSSSQSVGAGTAPAVDYDGFVGGGTIGYNWQFNPSWVAGIEADFQNGPSGSDPKGTVGPVVSCGTGPCKFKVNDFGTIRGRLGYTSNRVLYYVTGGWAYGKLDAGITPIDFGSAHTEGGVVGLGIEWAFAPNWSTKLEWLYVDFGNVDLGTGVDGALRQGDRFNDIRWGLNYLFATH